MKTPARLGISFWFWATVLLTLGKLWLTRGQPVYAIGPADRDDRLFLLLAESILKGEWLGAYNQMTLAKGPFYSLWIAVLSSIGIPLGLGVQLAYAGTCALFTRACRPAIRHGAVLFVVYAFLLWNPMSYEAPTLGRVIRQHLYTPLGLAIFAGLIALNYRRRETFCRQLPWAVVLGLALGCFWITREESIWLVPSVALLAVTTLWFGFKESAGAGRTLVRSLTVAAVCAATPVLLVCWQNYRHYAWFGTVEFRSAEYNDAYGAMVRVKIGPELPQVPVTRQAREAMYAVSPALATIRPWLDGPIGNDWAEKELFPAAERQIRGGWFLWALRDSVAAAGHAHNAKVALAFYRQVAKEINRACDDGRLPAHPPRSGMLPVWREGQTAEVLRTTKIFADYVTQYVAFSARPMPSIGTEAELKLFRELTRDHLSPVAEAANLDSTKQALPDDWKIVLLDRIGEAQQRPLYWLFVAAEVLALIRFGQLAWTRRLTFTFVLALAAWGGSLAYLLVNALVQVTSFNVVAVSTFWPVYPLLQVFTIAVFWDATEWFTGRSRGDRSSPDSRD